LKKKHRSSFLLLFDKKSGNYWVAFANLETTVGYWPNSFFTSPSSSDSEISWGVEEFTVTAVKLVEAVILQKMALRRLLILYTFKFLMNPTSWYLQKKIYCTFSQITQNVTP